MTSSSDLFGGELFGDELMDMYNSAAVVGSGATDTIDSISEIPALLPAPATDAPATDPSRTVKEAVKEEQVNHPGEQVALAAAAIDDGLGAFRPSTSFNDLSQLDSSTGTSKSKSQSSPSATVVTTAELIAPVSAAAATATSKGAVTDSMQSNTPIKTEDVKSKKRKPTSAPAGTGPTASASVPKKRATVAKTPASVPTPAARHPTAPTTPAAGKTSIPSSVKTSVSLAQVGVASAKTGVVPMKLGAASAKTGVIPMKPVVVSAKAGAGKPVQGKASSGSNTAAAGKNTPNPLTFPKAHAISQKASTTPPPAPVAPTAAAVVTPKAVPPPPAGPVPPAAVVSAPKPTPVAPSLITSRVQTTPAALVSAPPPKPNVPASLPPTAVPRTGPLPPRPVAATAAAAAAAAAAVVAAGNKVKPIGVPVSVARPSRGEPTTEADFKGVAQQAVTNLIMNASAVKPGPVSSAAATAGKTVSAFTAKTDDSHKKPVDTSSAHIAALTSTNWVAACSASVAGAPPGTQAAAQAAALAAAAAANDPAIVKANRAKRANLTPDERARQNRDRNREHARNTRLRKKAYVEELKRTLTELVAQRDATDLEKRHEAQRDLEVREVRFRVMEEFLKLRSQGGNANALMARWVAILEDGFTLTLPRTHYRATVRKSANKAAGVPPQAGLSRSVSIDNAAASARAAKIQQTLSATEQVLRGAPEVMEDASYLASFINSFGNVSSAVPMVGASTSSVGFAYHCDRKKFMMDGVTAVLEWTASSSGAISKGAPAELVMKGTMRATFSPASNKLVCAELLFDTGAVTTQMKSLYVSPTPVVQEPCDAAAVAAAAQMTASEADALLDSIQMPQLAVDGVPPAQTQSSAAPSSVSITSSDKGESSDESVEDTMPVAGAVQVGAAVQASVSAA